MLIEIVLSELGFIARQLVLICYKLEVHILCPFADKKKILPKKHSPPPPPFKLNGCSLRIIVK